MNDKKVTIFDPNRIFSNNFVNTFFSDMPFVQDSNELEMYEDENNVVVKFKAPGFETDDININVIGKILELSGEKTTQTEENEPKRKYYYKSSESESFSRTIALPTGVKADEAKAQFKNGILTIELPKLEEVKPKKIEIKAQ